MGLFSGDRSHYGGESFGRHAVSKGRPTCLVGQRIGWLSDRLEPVSMRVIDQKCPAAFKRRLRRNGACFNEARPAMRFAIVTWFMVWRNRRL